LYAPAAFAFDAGENFKDFFLFTPVAEAFSSDGETAKGSRRNATRKTTSVNTLRDVLGSFQLTGL
jgi:hypothetical protein